MVYLLSDLSAHVNGQILVTGGEKLSVLGRPRPTKPAVRHTGWDVGLVRQAVEELTS